MYRDEIIQPHLLSASTRRLRFFSTTTPDRTTARANFDFLTYHNVTVLPWPSRSPDLNPMDHLWDRLDKCVCMRQPVPQTLLQNQQALQGPNLTFNSSNAETTNGGHTRY